MSETERQEYVDRFYWSNGPCCAGCDWWRHHNSVAGECTRRAPDFHGFPVTARNYVCGEFQDSFDWQSLPLAYLARVNFQPRKETQQ